MKLRLENVRLSFPRLFTPENFQGDGEERYSCGLIVPSPKFKATLGVLTPEGKTHYGDKKITLEDAVDQVGKAFFKDKWAATRTVMEKKDGICLRDGDLKADVDGYAGSWYINASAQVTQRPAVKDRRGNPVDERSGIIYGGCYVYALIELWAQDNQYGKRINAQIRGVQFYADGDAFGAGGAASDDEFEDLSEGADAGGFDDNDDIG